MAKKTQKKGESEPRLVVPNQPRIVIPPPGMKQFWVLALVPIFASSLKLATTEVVLRGGRPFVAFEKRPPEDVVPILVSKGMYEKLKGLIKDVDKVVLEVDEVPPPGPEKEQNSMEASGEEE